MTEKKMYVLVLETLSHSQRAVQAGHALAQYLLLKPKPKWSNGILILLKIKNEQELSDWHKRLGGGSICFREPDIGNQMTALACVSDGKEFRELRLL